MTQFETIAPGDEQRTKMPGKLKVSKPVPGSDIHVALKAKTKLTKNYGKLI